MVLGNLASWEERRAAKRAAKRAMARSDEIDRQIRQDSNTIRRRCDVLLIWYYILPLGH